MASIPPKQKKSSPPPTSLPSGLLHDSSMVGRKLSPMTPLLPALDRNSPMRLAEVCEPLFQYICTLNRSARKGGGIYDQSQVRADIERILGEIKYAATPDAQLLERYQKIELILLFFVDSMIRRSQLSFADDWQDMAYEREELAGDDRFFELLDETLKDRSDSATDQLGVYYTCIGLGFTGWYAGQPEALRKKMLELSARVRGLFDPNPSGPICPDAYAAVNTSNLIQPPAAGLVGIGIALIGFIGVLLATYVYLYHDSSVQLSHALKHIVEGG